MENNVYFALRKRKKFLFGNDQHYYSLLKSDNMKVYQTNEIKNIALLGSKGSGKTTLAEAMLYECGVIKRRDRKSVV